MSAPRHDIRIHDDAAELARAAAEDLVRLAGEAVEVRGRLAVVLAGGSSPRDLYRLLATPELAGRIPWEGMHLFWGDERCVPPGHPRSNFGMASRELVSRVPLRAANVHRIRGELGADRAAREYEAELRGFFGGAPPRFDLVHLGLGEDGHVASLFPFDLPRLLERERMVVPALHGPLGEPRVTLTFPALDAAARVDVLVPGEGKARIVREVVQGPLDPLRLPAQRVLGFPRKVVWFLCRRSARNLRTR